jgi:hypothetical protein
MILEGFNVKVRISFLFSHLQDPIRHDELHGGDMSEKNKLLSSLSL